VRFDDARVRCRLVLMLQPVPMPVQALPI